MARQLVYAQYGEETYSRGLHVHLTVNSVAQKTAYSALRSGLMDYELRQVYRGPEAYVELPGDASTLDARVAEACTLDFEKHEFLFVRMGRPPVRQFLTRK